MRTDSVSIAPEAIEARAQIHPRTLRHRISSRPRPDNIHLKKSPKMPTKPSARPTFTHPPRSIQQYLTIDQYKLYLLIWRRFIASQMNPAIYDTVSADIEHQIKISSSAPQAPSSNFPAFSLPTKRKKTKELPKKTDEEQAKFSRLLKKANMLQLSQTSLSDQSFTKPPPRFTEASLVKELEKSGIGRPSTYASIMNKIQSRDYTIKEKGPLKPTELGKVIAKCSRTISP